MSDSEKNFRIWETNYGADCGWTIELGDEEIGLLSDPRPDEMFYTSYRLEITTGDDELAERMESRVFWEKAAEQGVKWRNREFGTIVEDAHPSPNPFPEPGRLSMRALRIPLREPGFFEKIKVWFRRWRKARRQRAEYDGKFVN